MKKIQLKNKNTGDIDIYTMPTYTKLNGVYGYICVDVDLVVRFFYEHDGVAMDTLDYFEVSIISG